MTFESRWNKENTRETTLHRGRMFPLADRDPFKNGAEGGRDRGLDREPIVVGRRRSVRSDCIFAQMSAIFRGWIIT